MNTSKNLNFLSRLESHDGDNSTDTLNIVNQDSSFKFTGLSNVKPDVMAEQRIANSGISSPKHFEKIEQESYNQQLPKDRFYRRQEG